MILTIESLGYPPGQMNYLRFEDYSTDSGTRDEAILEVFVDLGDTFVGKPVVAKPTDTSVAVSMTSLVNLDVYAEYGPEPGAYSGSTAPLLGRPAGQPIEIAVTGLEPDTTYYYRVRYRQAGGSTYSSGDEGRFSTQRAPGSSFTFTIQADSHALPLTHSGKTAGLRLYERCLSNVGMDGPDFHFSMGDFANIESYASRSVISKSEAVERYLEQRKYLDPVLSSAAFYLVIGNHEGEQGWRTVDPNDSIAIWGTLARKETFANPEPNGFYSGDSTVTESCGLRQSYYSWEWGDALFVVLDPYWRTVVKPHSAGGTPGSEDPWDWTLGEEQYNWLYDVLHDSGAKWKFVFIHHVTGGVHLGGGGLPVTPYGRGGVEVAKYQVDGRGSYEWGGEGRKGRYVFSNKRPGWAQGPIHDLMVNGGVSIVFQGHDHVYAQQTLDGVIYQTCPQPADSSYGDGHRAAGAYSLGEIQNNSGHLRVAVSEEVVQVDYVRAVLPEDEPILEGDSEIWNGDISHSYSFGIAGTGRKEDRLPRPLLVGVMPNPFRIETRILFSLPERETVALKVYDVAGRQVASLFSEMADAGLHEVVWEVGSGPGRPSPGIYFCRLELGSRAVTRKIMLLR
jgi:hypothetical protein